MVKFLLFFLSPLLRCLQSYCTCTAPLYCQVQSFVFNGQCLLLYFCALEGRGWLPYASDISALRLCPEPCVMNQVNVSLGPEVVVSSHLEERR